MTIIYFYIFKTLSSVSSATTSSITTTSMRKIIRDILNRHPHLRVRIESLEESYFSLLTGNSVPTDIWRGLWTSPQLDLFRISHENHFIPDQDLRTLQSLFISLGKALVAGTTMLWYARQQTIYELVQYMKTHPDPLYTPPDRVAPSLVSLAPARPG